MKILVIGAVGQIGSELTMALREKYGNENGKIGKSMYMSLSENFSIA